MIGARGGYGSAQLLPLLDRADLVGTPKAFIGHSDLTALLVYLTIHCGVVCFHGPTVVNLAGGDAAYDPDSLLGSLMTPAPMGELACDGVRTLRPGDARGPLLGAPSPSWRRRSARPRRSPRPTATCCCSTTSASARSG